MLHQPRRRQHGCAPVLLPPLRGTERQGALLLFTRANLCTKRKLTPVYSLAVPFSLSAPGNPPPLHPPVHPSLPLPLTRTHPRTGELFAQSPYKPTKANPNGGCEAVLDSSRYFVLTVVDATSGQKAYVGMGFPERTESFDFNVALQVRTASRGAFVFA